MPVWSDWVSITPYSLIDLGVLAICFALAGIFYISNYKLGRHTVDLIFANCLACITVMAFGFFNEDNTESPLIALRWARINYSVAALFFALQLHFVFEYLNLQGRWSAKIMFSVYGLSVIAVGATYSKDFYHLRTAPLEPRSWINVSPAFPGVSATQNIFTVVLLLPSAFILIKLYQALAKAPRDRRETRRTKLLFYGMSALCLFIIIDYGLYAIASVCTISSILLGGLIFCLCATVALSDDILNRKRLEEALSKYVSPHVTDEVLNKGLVLEGRGCEVTVLFADIRDFTGITHSLGLQGITDFLSHYLDKMTKVVVRHQGMLIQTVGDGLLAVFGANGEAKNHEFSAVKAALDLLSTVEAFNLEGRYKGRINPLRIGIGIHSGVAMIGNIGGGEHLDYRVTGEVVNIASRVERFSKVVRHPLLITETTYTQIKELVLARPVGAAPIKEGESSIAVLAVDGLQTIDRAIDPRENVPPAPAIFPKITTFQPRSER